MTLSLALLITLAFAVGFARQQAWQRLAPDHVAHVASAQPELVRITGRVISEPWTATPPQRNPFVFRSPEPRTTFVLAAHSVETGSGILPLSGAIRVRVNGPAAKVGVAQRLTLTGWLSAIPPRRNPGEADWRHIFALQGIHASLRVESPENTQPAQEDGGGLLDTMRFWRTRLRALLFEPHTGRLDSDEAALIDTMVLGQRASLSPTVEQAFLRTGSIHFLVVSGFQIVVVLAFVSAAVMLIARLLDLIPLRAPWSLAGRRRVIGLAGTLTIMAYLAVVDWDASVLRAVTMAVVGCTALLLGRPVCTLNWLSLSALLLLLFDPAQLFRPGFQLSFVCVLALCTTWPTLLAAARARGELWASGGLPVLSSVVAPSNFGIVGQLVRWTASLILLTLGMSILAWIVAAPIVAFHFGQFHPYAAVSCTVLAAPVVLATWLGFVAVFGGTILPPLGWLGVVLLNAVSGVILSGVGWLAALPGSVLTFQPPPFWLVLATYSAILWAMQRLRHWSRRVEMQVQAWQAGRPHGYEHERRRLMFRALIALTPTVALMLTWPGWLALRSGAPAAPAVHVLSVGNGNAVLVTSPRSAFLMDAGTIADFDAGRTVVTAAAHLGVRRLEAVAISHANFDHFSGVPTVLAEMGAAPLFSTRYFFEAGASDSGVRRLLRALPQGAARRVLNQGDELTLGDWHVDVLWPRADLPDWTPNDTSLVLMLSARGRRILLTGDVERRALRELLADHAAERIDLTCDALLAPHHGDVEGDETAQFLKVAAPRYVVVSSGSERPRFTDLVRAALGEQCALLVTSRDGAASIRVGGHGELEVSGMARQN